MQCVPVLSLSVQLTVAVSTKRFVTISGTLSTSGNNALGVSRFAGIIGQWITIDCLGTAIVEAGSAIPVGSLIQSDLNGKAAIRGAGAVLGRALSAATGDGSLIEVLLIPN
jgi:hypothetical protein